VKRLPVVLVQRASSESGFSKVALFSARKRGRAHCSGAILAFGLH